MATTVDYWEKAYAAAKSSEWAKLLAEEDVGAEDGNGFSSMVALHRPTSAIVKLNKQDALYPGERYIVETVKDYAIPHSFFEFVMPARDITELKLSLERPKGNINLVLVDAKRSEGHWSATLPLPKRAKIRVRHATLGVVVPEKEILASTGTYITAKPSQAQHATKHTSTHCSSHS